MSRTATKASGNVFYMARMEAVKYNSKFSSREGVAEALSLDRTRLARIELGVLSPYPEEALLLAEAYNAPHLANQYCCKYCPIGKQTVALAEETDLYKIMVEMHMLTSDFVVAKDLMLKVYQDGEVSEHELPDRTTIRDVFKQAKVSIEEFLLWDEKNTR